MSDYTKSLEDQNEELRQLLAKAEELIQSQLPIWMVTNHRDRESYGWMQHSANPNKLPQYNIIANVQLNYKTGKWTADTTSSTWLGEHDTMELAKENVEYYFSNRTYRGLHKAT